MVLNAFQIAQLAREQASKAKPVTTAQARKRAADAKKKSPRVVRVMDTAGRCVALERKSDYFVIEGSISGRQSAEKRAAMRRAQI